MYVPPHFAETRPEVLHDLIRTRPLATLVTLSPAGLDANEIPLLLHSDEGTAALGTLRGHVARANPLWREHPAGSDVLAIFRGPQTYISPSWYPAKAETGKVVPTWNYAVVHAHGRLTVIEDREWLRSQIEALTRQQEGKFAKPWDVADAPADFVEKMIGAIVGIEIELSRLEGKWKTSQNQPPANREGVVRSLTEWGTETAAEMARLVQERGG